MSLFIAGIGTAVPPYAIAQPEACERIKTVCCHAPEHERLLHVLYRRSGVERRHSVVLEASDGDPAHRQHFFPPAQDEHDRGPTTARRMQRYDQEAAALGEEASRTALEKAGVAAERITHLVTVSCSGFSAPGFDVGLIKRLGLSAGVSRTHVGFMGCHGALNGLRVARAFTGADPHARVLLCAVELCSLHIQYGWNPDWVVANSLFADGAAALVGVNQREARPPGWHVASSGSVVVADSEDAMTWRIGDHGFEMSLSAQVPQLICEHLRPWLADWLGREGLTVETVASWAVHPGGPRILSAFCEAAGLDRSVVKVSEEVLAEYGNMSSPTVLFILDRLQRRHAPTPCVALAFGPGLTVEAVLFR